MRKSTEIILLLVISSFLAADGYGGWGSLSLGKVIAVFQNGSGVTTLNIGNKLEVDTDGDVIVNGINDADAAFDDLQVGDGSGNAGITIRSGSSSTGALIFSRGTSGAQLEGGLRYSQGSRAFDFYTATSRKMTLDASGGLGLGTSSPDERLELEWAAAVDAEIGRGTTDTDVTFIKLRSPDGTAYYIYPANGGASLTISATKP